MKKNGKPKRVELSVLPGGRKAKPKETREEFLARKLGEVKAKEQEVIHGGGGPTEAGWHQAEAFLRCPKAYQFASIRGIRKPLVHTPDHFALGGLFHAMRARWFALRFASDSKAWDRIRQAALEEKERATLPISAEAERRALDLMQLYMDHWLMMPRPTPIAAEYKLGPAPLQPGDPFFLYRTARLDDASKYPEAGGQLALGECKTTSGSVADVVRQYELHGQPLLQLLLWKMCPNGEAKFGPAAGIMLDVAVKPYENKPAKFERIFLPVKPRVVEWYAQSMRGYLQAMASVSWDSEVPRNTQGCTYMAGRARVNCEFKELCLYGKESSGNYVLRDGSSLRAHKPRLGMEKMPWE